MKRLVWLSSIGAALGLLATVLHLTGWLGGAVPAAWRWLVEAWAQAWGITTTHGLNLLYVMARYVGFTLALWLVYLLTNRMRDKDERRNIGVKERVVITRWMARARYWQRRAEAAEELAAERKGALEAARVETRAAVYSVDDARRGLDSATARLAAAGVQLRVPDPRLRLERAR